MGVVPSGIDPRLSRDATIVRKFTPHCYHRTWRAILRIRFWRRSL